MKYNTARESGPCEAWQYIGVPKVKCEQCSCWFIENTSRHPEFCGDECYQRFLEEDPETLPMEVLDALR